MKIFIFSIINYIAGFHLLPEFTDVEEINTLNSKLIEQKKSARSIHLMAFKVKEDGHSTMHFDI